MRVLAMLRKISAAGFFALAAASGQAAEAPATAFVGVNVIPMTDSHTVLTDQTVLVAGGRIRAIGAARSTRIPAGARRIDGKGRYLMPGLADMHVHLEYLQNPDILKLFLAYGVTTVRSMDGRPYVLDWRRRVAAGTLEGPSIVTAGPIIDGSPPLRDDNLAVADAAAAAAAVNAQADAGYDFVKLYTNLSNEAYRGAIGAAKARTLPVAGHVPRRIDTEEAAAAQASIEHLADYGDDIAAQEGPEARRWHWSKRYLAMPAAPAKMAVLAARLSRTGVWTVPTLIQADRELGTATDIAVWQALPGMAFVPESGRQQWLGQVRGASGRLDVGDWEVVKRGRANRLALVKALHGARAKLLLGTDTPNPFVVPGASVHEELRNYVAAGLTAGEALHIATRGAASFLGRERDSGSIEPGRTADFILLDGNPLADVANSSRLTGVMRAGRWYDKATLETFKRALTAK